MIMKTKQQFSYSGFSLVELLVVIFILSVILGAIYSSIIQQKHSAIYESATSSVQVVGESIITLLRRDIMMAGYGVDKKLSIYIEDGGNSNPDKIYLNDYSVIDNRDLANGFYGHIDISNAFLNITSLSSYNHDINGDGTDDFVDCNSGNNAQKIITDLVDLTTGNKVATIICNGSDNYALDQAVRAKLIAPAIYYEINNNRLRRSDSRSAGAQPIAGGEGGADDLQVVDLQVAYRANGTWYCNDPSTACPSSSTFDPEDIELIRLNVVVRSRSLDKIISSTRRRPQVENRVGSNTDDNFTYRVFSETVAPRNLMGLN